MTERFAVMQQVLADQGFNIIKMDDSRPWGGFFVIDEAQTLKFVETFFGELNIDVNGKLSPKILVINPGKRLSWQYHNRRAEIWRVYDGDVGVRTSDNDEPGRLKILEKDDIVRIKVKERHRLIGMLEHSIVAEIWEHTNPEYPSDENDIVRVQDDYDR